MINVELKGGTVKEFESGVTPAEIAKSIGMGLYKSVCCRLAYTYYKGLQSRSSYFR